MKHAGLVVAALLAFALASASACGSPKPAPASAPTPAQQSPTKEPAKPACLAPEPGAVMTEEQCGCLGGRLNPSRGGEQEHCERGETELGAVRFGIEGGWCCKAVP